METGGRAVGGEAEAGFAWDVLSSVVLAWLGLEATGFGLA